MNDSTVCYQDASVTEPQRDTAMPFGYRKKLKPALRLRLPLSHIDNPFSLLYNVLIKAPGFPEWLFTYRRLTAGKDIC